jgi:hypothetical protein
MKMFQRDIEVHPIKEVGKRKQCNAVWKARESGNSHLAGHLRSSGNQKTMHCVSINAAAVVVCREDKPSRAFSLDGILERRSSRVFDFLDGPFVCFAFMKHLEILVELGIFFFGHTGTASPCFEGKDHHYILNNISGTNVV